MFAIGTKVTLQGFTDPFSRMNGTDGIVDSVTPTFLLVKLESGYMKVKSRNLRIVEDTEHNKALEKPDNLVIKAGMHVVMHSLKSKTEWNGNQGIVCEYVPEKDQWTIFFHANLSGADMKGCGKAENLRMPTKADDALLINSFVCKRFNDEPFIGKVVEMDSHGFFVRYQDGDREHLKPEQVVALRVDLKKEEKDRYEQLILRYTNSPSDTSDFDYETSAPNDSLMDLESPVRRRGRPPKRREPNYPTSHKTIDYYLNNITKPEDDSDGMEIDTPELPKDTVAASAVASPGSSVGLTVMKINKPVLFFHPVFLQHNGGGQDEGGLWLKAIRDLLESRGFFYDLPWVDTATALVGIEAIAATGVHSLSYLQVLDAVGKEAKADKKKIDLASQKVIKTYGRSHSGFDKECVIDYTTWDAVMLRVGLTRDALFAILRDQLDTGFLLSRPACHHVPYIAGVRSNQYCEVCEKSDNTNKLLICDAEGCNKAYHTYCLTPIIPDSTLRDPIFLKYPWFCPTHKVATPKLTALCSPNRHVDMVDREEVGEIYPPEMKIKNGDELACGFCFVNATAYSIVEAKNHFPGVKVAIVDFDVHAGNGNEHVFYKDPQVLHISAHRFGDTLDNQRIMPATGHFTKAGDQEGVGYNINIEMRSGDGDAEYSDVAREIVFPILKEFKPDVVLLLCGFDALDHSEAPTELVGPGMDCTVTPLWYWWLVDELRNNVGIKKILCTTEGGYYPITSSKAAEGIVRALGGERVPQTFRDQLKKPCASKEWRKHLAERKQFFHQIKWKLIDPSV